MIPQVLSHFSMPYLTCIGLILFMLVFIGALAWVYRKGSDLIYQDLETLPIEDIKNV